MFKVRGSLKSRTTQNLNPYRRFSKPRKYHLTLATHSFLVQAEHLFPFRRHSLSTLRMEPEFHAGGTRRPLKRWKKTKWFTRESWKPSSLPENWIRRGSAKFNKYRSVASSRLFRMNYLVDAVGIEPTTCRLRADDQGPEHLCFQWNTEDNLVQNGALSAFVWTKLWTKPPRADD